MEHLTDRRRWVPTVLALATGGLFSAAEHAEAAPCRAASAERETLCLVNQERTARDLPPLKPSRALAAAAESYAVQMVRDRRFAHVAGDGSTPAARIRRTGYLRGAKRWLVGECIGWGGGGKARPRAIVAAWMKSPGHRRLILSKRMRHVGAGVTLGSPTGHAGGAATYALELGWRTR